MLLARCGMWQVPIVRHGGSLHAAAGTYQLSLDETAPVQGECACLCRTGCAWQKLHLAAGMRAYIEQARTEQEHAIHQDA